MQARSRKAVSLAIGILLVAGAQARAKTFEVTRTNDPVPGLCGGNDCSLREAVQAANARPGADTILLPGRKKPYKLTIPGDTADDASDGDLDVTNDELAIVHRGRGRAKILGVALQDRLFDTFNGSPLRLSKLKLSGGAVPPSNGTGGAIRAADAVKIQQSVVANNSTDEDGGAIDTDFRLTIVSSVIAGNRATGQGGALHVGEDAPTRIVGSVLRGNQSLESTGGAIRNSAGDLTIIRSRFIGNRANDGSGGAIRNALDGDVLISRSEFTGNFTDGSGGALELNESEISIRRSTFANNRALDEGGAIHVAGSPDTRISGTTISGNRAQLNGGGIFAGSDANLSIVNSTVANNRALDFGGGIDVRNDADLTLNAVTIARNHGSFDDEGALAPGGGIFRNTTGLVTVRNSILALNKIGADPQRNDCGGEVGEPFDSLGNNLLSVTSSICNGFDEPGDRVRSNPRIGKLRDNGGPTKTIALKKGSPAIGTAHKPSAPKRDQRNRKRDNKPDIGAFERGA